MGGEFGRRRKGVFFENISPVTGQPFTEIARSTAEDVDLALDAAHGAKRSWGRTSATERANILNKIADRLDGNLQTLPAAPPWAQGNTAPRPLPPRPPPPAR